MAVSKEIFDALITLLGDGKIEIPDIEQIRAISKVNKTSKEERERNREINIITAKIRGRAANGYFDLGEHVMIQDKENVNALISGGYVVVEKRDEEGKYFISWDENVIPSTPITPIDKIPLIPLTPADKIPDEGDKDNVEDGANDESSV